MLLTSALLSCKIASYLTFSFNLHVLGLPPAFVLSQDQTLILIDVFHPVCFLLHFKRISWFLFRNITDFIFYIIKYTVCVSPLLIHCFFITLRFLSTTSSHNLSSTSHQPVSRFIEQQSVSVNRKNQKKSFFLHFYFKSLFLLLFFMCLLESLLGLYNWKENHL